MTNFYIFKQDDDGHWYCIKENDEQYFDNLLETDEESFIDEFEDCIIGGHVSLYRFENPSIRK